MYRRIVANILLVGALSIPLAAEKIFEDSHLPNPIVLKVHESFAIRCKPLHKNINWLRYEVEGDAIKLLRRNGDRIHKGSRFEFEALKEGNATLIRTLSRYAKRSKDQREISRYRISVHR